MEDHINLVSMFDLPQITSQRKHIHHVTKYSSIKHTRSYTEEEEDLWRFTCNSNKKEIISARRIEGRSNGSWNDLRETRYQVYGWKLQYWESRSKKYTRWRIAESNQCERVRHQPIISHSSPPTDPSKSVEFCCLTCTASPLYVKTTCYGRIDDKDWIKSHVNKRRGERKSLTGSWTETTRRGRRNSER